MLAVTWAEPVTAADRLAGSDVGLHPRVREIDAEAMTQRSIELVEALNVASVEAARTAVAGVLISDDSVDLDGHQLEALAWMRQHTPELFPWINQIGVPEATAWPARRSWW